MILGIPHEYVCLVVGPPKTRKLLRGDSGYNTRWCHQSGMLPLPKTDVTFLPLIDNPSAHPDGKY